MLVEKKNSIYIRAERPQKQGGDYTDRVPCKQGLKWWTQLSGF